MLQSIKSILLKTSFKQVAIYTITASLCKAISFAALPFFVNILSAGDIGILTIFSNCIVFLTPIISLGTLYTISIDYFKLSKEKYAEKFSAGILIPIVFSLLLVPVLYIFSAPLARGFNFQPTFFWLIPLCLFLNFCFEAFIILMRNQNNVRLFTIVSLVKILLEIGLSIFFIFFIYKNWYSRALGYLLSGVVIGVLFFLHIRKNKFLVKRVNYLTLKKELYFGLSGLILQTAIFFLNSSDKFFAMAFFGKEKAGYYSVASTFAAIQYIVCAALLQYLTPVLYKNFAKLQTWRNLQHLYYKFFLAMFVTLIGVTIFTYMIYHFILKTEYKEYACFSYILGAGSFLWAIGSVFLQYIIFNKNKKVIFHVSILTIFISVVVNYLASKYLAIQWLCVAQIISSLLTLLVILYYNKKQYFFNFDKANVIT